MCCALQFSKMEVFLTQSEEFDFDDCFPVLRKTTPNNEFCNRTEAKEETMAEPVVRPKSRASPVHSTSSSSFSSEEDPEIKKKKKKKKWSKLTLADTGFKISLFPRPTSSPVSSEEEDAILNKIEAEIDDNETMLCRCEKFHVDEDQAFDGISRGSDKYIRRDRDRRVQKAHKQIKDKHCFNITNNDGRKKLFIHHRLFKLINLEVRRMSFLPSPKFKSNYEIKNNDTNETRSRLKPHAPVPYRAPNKPAPVQNLRHTLHKTNAPSDFEANMLNLLISLQHREVTPEDYELLCQLDESVAPKTLDKSLLTSFKTDTATSDNVGDVCTVCMDHYEVGQNRKWLPCEHVFHTACIDMWLDNSSRNCPVDGLPVDGNS